LIVFANPIITEKGYGRLKTKTGKLDRSHSFAISSIVFIIKQNYKPAFPEIWCSNNHPNITKIIPNYFLSQNFNGAHDDRKG